MRRRVELKADTIIVRKPLLTDLFKKSEVVYGKGSDKYYITKKKLPYQNINLLKQG